MTIRGTFHIGDIVFATCIGLKPWPATVTKIFPINEKASRLSLVYDVKFINHPSSASLLDNDITEFTMQKIQFLQNLYKNSTDEQEMGILKAIEVALSKRERYKLDEGLSKINQDNNEDKRNFMPLYNYDSGQSQMQEQPQSSSQQPSDYLEGINLSKRNLQHLNLTKAQNLSQRFSKILQDKKMKQSLNKADYYKKYQNIHKQEKQISIIEISDSFPVINSPNVVKPKRLNAFFVNDSFLLSVEWHNRYETITNCQQQMKSQLQSYPADQIHSFIKRFVQMTLQYLIVNKNNGLCNECHPLERKYAFVGCLANSDLKSLLRHKCFEIMIQLVVNFHASMRIEQLNCFGQFMAILKKLEQCFCQYLCNSKALRLNKRERDDVEQQLKLFESLH